MQATAGKIETNSLDNEETNNLISDNAETVSPDVFQDLAEYGFQWTGAYQTQRTMLKSLKSKERAELLPYIFRATHPPATGKHPDWDEDVPLIKPQKDKFLKGMREDDPSQLHTPTTPEAIYSHALMNAMLRSQDDKRIAQLLRPKALRAVPEVEMRHFEENPEVRAAVLRKMGLPITPENMARFNKDKEFKKYLREVIKDHVIWEGSRSMQFQNIPTYVKEYMTQQGVPASEMERVFNQPSGLNSFHWSADDYHSKNLLSETPMMMLGGAMLQAKEMLFGKGRNWDKLSGAHDSPDALQIAQEVYRRHYSDGIAPIPGFSNKSQPPNSPIRWVRNVRDDLTEKEKVSLLTNMTRRMILREKMRMAGTTQIPEALEGETPGESKWAHLFPHHAGYTPAWKEYMSSFNRGQGLFLRATPPHSRKEPEGMPYWEHFAHDSDDIWAKKGQGDKVTEITPVAPSLDVPSEE